jgi:DDE superfamily endonuclease/Tc5 transposase DNA-binding domain
MGYKRTSEVADREQRLQDAISAYKNQEFDSIRAAANHFRVSDRTMSRRLEGGLSRVQAREMTQILSNAEEKTLVRWVSRYTCAGSPITSALLLEMAELIRHERVRHASQNSSSTKIIAPIGHEWLYRFLNRHPTIQSIYARQLEAARFNGASYEKVKAWFDAVAAKFQERAYNNSNIWNMDESGFGVGESQTTKVLVPVDRAQQYKTVVGKQEWVTVIECINAAGGALPPMIIFKGQNLNSGWLPPQTPPDWHFGVSENGWTSNILGLQWLIKVFEPQTREKAAGQPRLLIADGHGSHIRADFIAHCMENDIDLLIMPPHCSHLLQPLDVGVFSAFKRAHSNETDTTSRLSTQRISRPEWMEMFIRARAKAVKLDNILGGWRGAGLVPNDPQKVLKHLPQNSTQRALLPITPPEGRNLNFSLLHSSPPDGTELRESNVLLDSVLAQTPGLPSPVKRYVARVTRMTETLAAENTLLRRQNQGQEELLKARKSHKRGKRVRLEGEFVYSTDKVLKVAREEEEARPAKRPRRRPRRRVVIKSDSEDEDEVSDCSSSSFGDGISVVVPRRRLS